MIINGWNIYQHPLFEQQFEHLVEVVEGLKLKDPLHYKDKKPTKILKAIHKLAFEKIPEDPLLPEYRQGNALGPNYKHWFRAKFFQQYRLFFRYHQESKVIIYAWPNLALPFRRRQKARSHQLYENDLRYSILAAGDAASLNNVPQIRAIAGPK